MKKYITIATLIAAGAACANAAPQDWTEWKTLRTWDTENTGGILEDQTLAALGSSGDFAIKVDFNDLAYKSESTAGSYFIGVKFEEGGNNTYYGIRISEDDKREAYFFTFGSVKDSTSVARVSASDISGDVSAFLEYDSSEKKISIYLGETLLGYAGLNFDGGEWLTTKWFAIGAGSPPEDYSANNLSHSFEFGVGTTLSVAVPEPSAFGLLAGMGALALVASRRRRR